MNREQLIEKTPGPSGDHKFGFNGLEYPNGLYKYEDKEYFILKTKYDLFMFRIDDDGALEFNSYEFPFGANFAFDCDMLAGLMYTLDELEKVGVTVPESIRQHHRTNLKPPQQDVWF